MIMHYGSVKCYFYMCYWVKLRVPTGCNFQDGWTTWSPCAATLQILFMWKTAGNKLKLFHPVLCDTYFISHYHCYCVLSQLAVKIAEWFASVVDPDRCLRQIAFCAKGNFTLVLIRTKSFQIGLNHSYYVFGNSSTLYYIIALAFTAFLV